MKFRKDLNGLRAIAVISVVLFHFKASWIPGGFAGVDIFFVISGFLMTAIIMKKLEENSFNILDFYFSRANRIIPALSILCLTLIVFGWFYLTPIEYKALGKHIASSLSFFSNITYWRESGYFDATSHEKWLLHTWSLSAEWQFYIIYPIALVILKSFISYRNIKLTILGATVIGFIYCVIATYKWPVPAYYLLPTRAWEMLFGGVAYLYPFHLANKNKIRLESLGIALIIGAFLFISQDDLWPGYLALLPVLGTFSIIQASRDDSLLTGNFVFQKLGKWSYSIYLWHWPIVVFLYSSAQLTSLNILMGIFLSCFFGWVSYSQIERKILIKKESLSILKFSTSLGGVSLFVTALLAVTLYFQNGIEDSYRYGASTEKAKFLQLYQEKHRNLSDAYWLKCNSYSSLNEMNTLDIDKSCVTKEGDGGLFLWGDSHAEALSYGLRGTFKSYPFYQVTSASCSVSLHDSSLLTGTLKIACDHSNKLAIQKIEELKPKVVIVAQAHSHEKTDWNELYRSLEILGVNHLVIVGPVSQWKPSLPSIITKRHWNNSEMLISDVGLDLSLFKTDFQLKKETFVNGVAYISLLDGLCNKNKNIYSCKARVEGNNLLQVDYGHLSKEGSTYVVSKLISEKLFSLLN